MKKSGIGIDKLINLLCHEKYNTSEQDLRFLGPVMSNLSQLVDVRREILGTYYSFIYNSCAILNYQTPKNVFYSDSFLLLSMLDL